MRLIPYLILFISWLMPHTALATNLCDYYRSNVPALYKMLCGGAAGGSGGSKPAGASSTFSAAFNVSAASLPSEPSSYGLETIGSYLRAKSTLWTPNFSIIKGFNKFGAGVSTSGNNTFYGNDVVGRVQGKKELETFAPWEKQKSSLPHLNLGTSIRLYESKKGLSTKLGLSFRHNATTATLGGGPALMISWLGMTVGAGMTREKISQNMNYVTFSQFIISTRLFFVEFEYNQLRNFGGAALDPVHILTGTIYMGRLTLTAAQRRLNTLHDGAFSQNHFALQYLVFNKMSVGYLYNFLPGASSIATQFYL